MKSVLARVLISSGALLVAVASTACVDEARCDDALAGINQVRAEAVQRDARIAWLRSWQISMDAQIQGAGTDALRRQLAALEAENAVLAQRLERAERHLEEARAASPTVARTSTRRLDQAVPYDLTGFLERPRPSSKREAHGTKRAAEAGRFGRREAAPSGQRTLDETVPYE